MGTISTKRITKTLQKNPNKFTRDGNITGFDGDPTKVQKIKGTVARIYSHPYSFSLTTIAQSPFVLFRNGFMSMTKNRFSTSSIDSQQKNRRDPKSVFSIFQAKIPDKVKNNNNYLFGTDICNYNPIQKFSGNYSAFFGLRGFANEIIDIDLGFMLLGDITHSRKSIARNKAFNSQFETNGIDYSSSPLSYESKIQSQNPASVNHRSPNFVSTSYLSSDFEARIYYSRHIAFSNSLLEQNIKYEGSQKKFRNPV